MPHRIVTQFRRSSQLSDRPGTNSRRPVYTTQKHFFQSNRKTAFVTSLSELSRISLPVLRITTLPEA
jgi:hypothetical protein